MTYPVFDRFRSSVLALLLPLLALTLGGCQTLQFDPPGVTISDVAFTDATLFETSAIFTIRLSNGNPDPIVVDGGAYDIELSGVRVGRGLSANRVEIPRFEFATDEVVIHVSNLAMLSRLNRILSSGQAEYRVSGKVYVEHPLGYRRVRVEHDGVVEMPQDAWTPAWDSGLTPGVDTGY